MNATNLTQEEQNELKSLYMKLNNLYKEKAELEVLKKSREDKLKDEVASACEIKNKQGEIQRSKVKMPLVNAILDELYRDKPNKEEIKADTMDTYRQAIKNKEVNEDCIKSYISSDESIKENTDFIKEVYKESSILSKEILDALNAVLKEEFKIYLNAELVKSGYEVKEEKDNSEILELKEMIKKLIG